MKNSFFAFCIFISMVVYNITIKVAPQIEEQWLKWQKEEHIPEIMAMGLFHEYKMFVLLEQDAEDGPTYVIQYFASTIENYRKYVSEFSPALQKKHLHKWGNHFVAFRTVMQSVH
ncbi:MAG TPA: DUF4286 family protein [Chitinophagaceae bacterium]|nr:DUF4286 family protein [Chitinophagaceae bacterium]